MSKRLQDRVEDLATKRYGVGTALSADPLNGGWIIRVWDRKGEEITSEWTGGPKAEALRRMKDALGDALAPKGARAK